MKKSKLGLQDVCIPELRRRYLAEQRAAGASPAIQEKPKHYSEIPVATLEKEDKLLGPTATDLNSNTPGELTLTSTEIADLCAELPTEIMDTMFIPPSTPLQDETDYTLFSPISPSAKTDANQTPSVSAPTVPLSPGPVVTTSASPEAAHLRSTLPARGRVPCKEILREGVQRIFVHRLPLPPAPTKHPRPDHSDQPGLEKRLIAMEEQLNSLQNAVSTLHSLMSTMCQTLDASTSSLQRYQHQLALTIQQNIQFAVWKIDSLQQSGGRLAPQYWAGIH